MKREEKKQLEMVAKVRHDSQQRLKQAYHWLWQSVISQEKARKDSQDEPNRDVCQSVESPTGTRAND